MYKTLIVKAGLVTAAGLSTAFATTGAAHAAPIAHASVARVTPAVAVDGSNPETTGCAADARTVHSAYGWGGDGEEHVLVELRYSARCRSTWARVTSLSMPACAPGTDWCGDAQITRNTDGRTYTCYIQKGSHTCYTAQVNDAGVTSHAFGEADDGATTSMATTGSY